MYGSIDTIGLLAVFNFIVTSWHSIFTDDFFCNNTQLIISLQGHRIYRSEEFNSHHFLLFLFQLMTESKTITELAGDVYERLTHSRRSAFEWHVRKPYIYMYIVWKFDLKILYGSHNLETCKNKEKKIHAEVVNQKFPIVYRKIVITGKVETSCNSLKQSGSVCYKRFYSRLKEIVATVADWVYFCTFVSFFRATYVRNVNKKDWKNDVQQRYGYKQALGQKEFWENPGNFKNNQGILRILQIIFKKVRNFRLKKFF